MSVKTSKSQKVKKSRSVRFDVSTSRRFAFRPFGVFRVLTFLAIASGIGGCHTTQAGRGLLPARTSDGIRAETRSVHRLRRTSEPAPVRRVVCLYDQRPWLNLDAAGDRDPEGIHFRVFLDAGKGKGELRDGTLHVEMYRIDRESLDRIKRTLVSDWDLPTSGLTRVKSKILGMGYHLRLRWAEKETAGHEIEVITHFRDPDGKAVRSGTKRLHVPKYTSY